MTMRSITTLAATGLLGLALSGCAGLRSIDSDVSSFTQWPADRKPASYAFERLPSQQANLPRQEELEAAARDALTQAGFNEVSDAKDADVTVQLGLRVAVTAPYGGWDDPFWWHGGLGFYGGRHYRGWGPGWGPGWGWGGWGPGAAWAYEPPRYEREVAMLIRDRKSGQPLYETHASNEGLSSGSAALLPAMFIAALKDFPQPTVNPRRVTVPVAAN